MEIILLSCPIKGSYFKQQKTQNEKQTLNNELCLLT